MPESTSERLKLIDKDNSGITIKRQCELLDTNRSMVYYEHEPISDFNLMLMKKIDRLYTKYPFFGAPSITKHLNKIEKINVNHKRIERLMADMGIQAIYPKKKWNLSKPNKQHQKFPYLLKGANINYPDKVWGTDITYIQADKDWYYLVAIMDWFSRYVLSWQLSKSLSTDFCVLNLNQALKISVPEIHNSDQGSQFTADDYINTLQQNPEIRISMDGRGRCFDNIFTERLWRTVKYEEVYLKNYQSFDEANYSLKEYFKFYNTIRLHSSLNDRTPERVYFERSKSVSSN